MDNFWHEHVYLLYIGTIGLFILVGYLMRMVVKQGTDSMKKVTDSIGDLYDKYNGIARELSEFHGEHNAFIKNGIHDRRDHERKF